MGGLPPGPVGTVEELSLTYIEYAERWTTNPATGQVWTIAEVQALQAGAYLNYIDFGEIRITQLYTVVSVANPIVTTLYSYGKDDQLLREETLGISVTTYGYDKNGNTVSRTTTEAGTRTYGYDYENRLTAVTTPNTSETYQYAPDGRRLKRVAGGSPTYYGYDSAGASGYEDTIE